MRRAQLLSLRAVTLSACLGLGFLASCAPFGAPQTAPPIGMATETPPQTRVAGETARIPGEGTPGAAAEAPPATDAAPAPDAARVRATATTRATATPRVRATATTKATAVPPAATAVPATAAPATAVPPAATAVPPTAVPPTAVPPTAVPPTAVPEAFDPLRVRAGAPGAYTDSAGDVWSADDGASGGATSWWYTAPIAQTTDDPLYQTERYGNFGYRFAVPDGAYAVTLKFAETHWTGADRGRRVFDVQIEGQAVLTRFDILAEVAPNTALEKSFAVQVRDGALDLRFVTVADNAKVSAIEIVAGDGPPPSGTPAPPATAVPGATAVPATAVPATAVPATAVPATAVPATAVPTATANPGGQQLNASTFGACNAGNQAAAMQNAMNALVTGGTLTISCDVGIASPGVRLDNRQQVTIRGTNGGGFNGLGLTGIGVPGFSQSLFVVNNCDRCVIEDLEFNGNGIAQLLAGGLINSEDTVFQGNWLHNFGRQDSSNAGQTGGGMWATTGNHRNQYLNNTLENTGGDHASSDGIDGAQTGFWFGHNGADRWEWDAVIEGNTFRNLGSDAFQISIAGNATVRNNRTLNTRTGGIKFGNNQSGNAGLLLIEGNTIDGMNCMTGLHFSRGENADQSQFRVIVRNNIVRKIGTCSTGVDGHGIYLDEQPKFNYTVEGNLVEDNSGGEIFLHGGTNMVFRNNTVRNTAAAPVQPVGLGFQWNQTYTNVQVVCNTFGGLTGEGLRLGGTFNGSLTVTDNTFTGNGTGLGTINYVQNVAPQSARNAYSSNGANTNGGFAAGVGTPQGCAGPA